MELRKALASCALAALAAGCTVEPAMPLATVRVPAPVVVAPVPVLVAPAHHKPHLGRGWGHHKHGHRH